MILALTVIGKEANLGTEEGDLGRTSSNIPRYQDFNARLSAVTDLS